MKHMKRVISLLLCAVMLMGILAACGGSKKEESASSGNAAASSGDAAAASGDERITVKILKGKAANEVNLDEMEIFKVMGEKFNIDFEFDNPPSDNFEERLNLVMMDDQLPDVIMDMPMTDILKYGEAGVIIPLNDYIDNKMPNLKAAMDARDGVEKAITYADGNIYYVPMLDEKVSGNMPYIIRTDWLQALGMDSPVTLEDWEAYFEAVKTTDLNGNGQNDEIPFGSFDMTGLRNFVTAFGVLDDFYTDPDDGGKVHYGPIEDKYKEGLIWLNEMWNKGYIDQEIITMDYSSFSGKLAQNIVGSFYGPLGGMLAAQNATMGAVVEGFRVDATVPPKGTTQIHSNIDQEPRAVAAAVITATCKNVDRIVEWLDYMYGDEGSLLVNMGIEGTHYTMVDGEPVFTDLVMNNKDGLSPKNAVGTYSFAQSTGPFILRTCLTGQLDDEAVVKAKNECIIPYLENSKKYVISGSLSFNSEDDAIRREAMTDIETYVDEMVMKFITGRESLDNWDTYVAKVEQMGIGKVLDIYQTALDAWNAE